MANSKLPSLLLLPPPPTPATAASLKAAYGPSIKAAFTALTSNVSNASHVLEIALPCPQIHNKLHLPRSQIFKELTHLVAGLYSLACIICAEEGIEPEGVGGVDARVLLLAYNASEKFAADEPLSSLQRTRFGPIIDLPTLALSRRQWRYIFQVDGERGHEIYQKYTDLATRSSPAVKGEKVIISGGISLVSDVLAITSCPEGLATLHSVVIVGGTFDHLHAGHKLLLTATALLLQPATRVTDVLRRIVIGITGDELLKDKKYAEYLQGWKGRQEDVVSFLMTIFSSSPTDVEEADIKTYNEPRVNGKAVHTELKKQGIIIECVEINDPYGPTITDESVTALAVSAETRSGGAAVNVKRQEKGWNSLEVFEVEVLNAEADETRHSQSESFESKISSTAIRKRKAEITQKSSL